MTDDLSPLAWVQAELRRTLEAAHKALRRHVKEAAAIGASDVDSVDPSVLRGARVQLHQSAGALELVGLPPVAQVLRASEAAVQRMATKPALADLAAVETIEKASFAVLDFLSRQLAGKAVSPVMLFPQYRAVQQLAGADRVHPADLWPADFQWRELPADRSASSRRADDAARGEMETLVLALMRQPGPAALARASDFCADLGAGAPAGRPATFWQLAAAVFEAQSLGLLDADLYAKRLASRLLAQLRMGARGQFELSDRLAQDLLFFCAHARKPVPARPAPRLAAVRQAWAVDDDAAVADYETPRLGRFDPSVIALARKRLATARDGWSAVAGGELHRLAGLNEQFVLVGESVSKLFPSGERLSQALQVAAAKTVNAASEPAPTLAMEVATAVLYVDAGLEDGELDHPLLGERMQHLADRIDAVREGAEPRPLESWMEELYRRVSDRQTMGSVVHELRATLSEVEKEIDRYFRNPAQREVLIPVPGQLSAMRGVLSVLGMAQASQAVLHMRDDVDALAQTEVDPQRAVQTGTFDRLADNLGALSFLIDMLSVQPALAKSLFRFDPQTGLLSAVMGQSERNSAFTSLDGAPESASDALIDESQAGSGDSSAPLQSRVQALAAALADDSVPDDEVMQRLERLSQQAVAGDEPELARTLGGARIALRNAGDSATRGDLRAELSQGLFGLAPPPPPPLPPAAPVPPSRPVAAGNTGLEDDTEMRDIFIEEAREVLTDAHAAMEPAADGNDATHEMTVLRRAFHTLKGSGRMVGLRDFGEAAWACEQLFNARLAHGTRLDAPLRTFTGEALDYMSGWVEAIADNEQRGHQTADVAQAADALRLRDLRVPLRLPQSLDGAVPAPIDLAELIERVPDLPTASDLDLGLDTGPRPYGDVPALAAARVAPLDAQPPSQPMLPLPVAEEVSFDLDLRAFDGPEEPAPAPTPSPPPGLLPVLDLPLAHEAMDLPLVDEVVPEDLLVWPAGAEFPIAEVDLDLSASPAQAPAEAVPEPAVAIAEIWPQAERETDPEPMVPVAEVLFDPAFEPAAESMFDELLIEPTPEPVFEPVLGPVLLAEPALELPPPEPEPEPEPEPVDEEPVKIIGSLRIGIPLFNIFLNEADELSRRLSIELAEWAAVAAAGGERTPVADGPIALAHSLAGNSATVGYAELSALARELEHALMRSQAGGPPRLGEADLFCEAADEIRRLLHQFAAGFLRPVTPDLMHRLVDHERLPVAPPVPPAPPASTSSPAPPLAADVLLPAGTFTASEEPVLPDTVAPFSAPAAVEAAQPTQLAAVPLFAPAFSALDAVSAQAGPSTRARSDAFDDDDDIDSVDAVDGELFPIFEEEAEELLPQLQQRLRDWSQRPHDPGAAEACMRTLHTFKGGARLAGAMRLGEMAHRLETAIEHLNAREDLATADVEPLLGRADAMLAAFEALRHPGAEPVVAAPMAAARAFAAPTPASVSTPQEGAPLARAEPTVEAFLAAAVDEPAGQPTLAESASAVQAAPASMPALPHMPASVDWTRFAGANESVITEDRLGGAGSGAAVRVRAGLLDRLVNQAGEVSITRARIDADVRVLQGSLSELTDSLDRMRKQLRDIELQAESQINSRMEAAKAASQKFDPLEMDRFTRFQELTRFMAESVNDVATLQRSLQRTLQSTEDELAAQARLTRELQDDLLRTRMVEFESMADRLYRTVRQAAKETAKQVRLDIVGGAIEIDRGVLERMIGPFEHLLRNSVAHRIEAPDVRVAAGKTPDGRIGIQAAQAGNEVAIEFGDDGGGLDLVRIRQRGIERGLLDPNRDATDAELAQLIFAPGFSTAETVTELAGRGVGMDVVRAEVAAMGGRIETASTPGQGTRFRLLLPLTTAVTQVVMLRCGELSVAVPSTLIEQVKRVPSPDAEAAYASGNIDVGGGDTLPFFWLAALLKAGTRGEMNGRSQTLVIIRSAAQRVALHVDEVIGNQEVVVKNVGPQLSRLPGLAGVTLLPSGAAALIYNPVALAALYADSARELMRDKRSAADTSGGRKGVAQMAQRAPMVLVVDDSLTVRRVTQRLLVREGYRVVLAKDGMDALERLAEERPVVLLSDIEMPRMDGFDLLRNVRADARLAGLPVVMITSRIAQKHRDYAMELGVDHYLGKPYAEDELLLLVGRYAAAAGAAAVSA